MILPAFNEAAALPHVLDDLRQNLGADCEVIVVDDGSTDETSSVALASGALLERHQTNLGKGAAMATGVGRARGTFLVFMDADATYPAQAIPHLVKLLTEFDIVRGERPVASPNIPRINRLGNQLFNRFLASFHQLEGHDILSGLYGMTRDAFETLQIESSGFDVEVEIGVKAKQKGLVVGRFDIPYNERIGEKKLRPVRDGMNILLRVAGMAILYSPTVTFIVPGALIMALGFLGAFLLAGGPVFVGDVGLSVNSFVLASLGLLAGFQLIVIGVAATLYRVETGVPPTPWIAVAASRKVRLGAAVAGILAVAIGTIRLVVLVASWIGEGAGDFLATEALVFAASTLVFGLQLLGAGLFLSIFSGRLTLKRD